MVGSAQPALLTTRIARAALTELPRKCGAIALAGGSSAGTVVTNSLPIALLLAARPNVTLNLVGGRVMGGALTTVGDAATDFLNDVFVDVAFLGASGISIAGGLTVDCTEQAGVNRALVRAARRCVVLADHTTFAPSKPPPNSGHSDPQ